MHGPIEYLKQLWSTTSFSTTELSQYARSQLVDETRRGVMSMSLLLLALILFALPVYMQLQLQPVYLYTYLLIAVLSIHIFFSAKKMGDIKVLYLLGVTLLTISATAFISIAHQTSSFSILLFANVVLLFMAVPMVPWGMREASIVIFIIYALLTLSTSGMTTTFGPDTLLVLQFFMIAAAITSMILVARGVHVRKSDLTTRFDLESARAHLYELSFVDPLTGTWNRRFISTALGKLICDYEDQSDEFHYVLFDIDDFKQLNDVHGHDYGDKVLQCIGETFNDNLDNRGYLIRLGGDEFALMLVHEQPHDFVNGLCDMIEKKCTDINRKATVCLSYGLVSAPLDSETTLGALYLKADKAMYRDKVNSKALQQVTHPGKARPVQA